MNIKTKETFKEMRGTQKIQVAGTVVDTLQPVSSLSGSCRGAAFQKKVLTMTKDRSPHVVTFSPDAEDPFFVDVRIVRKSTGELRASHYILKSDVPQWVGMFETDGFSIVEQTNE